MSRKIALYTVNVGGYDSPKNLVLTPYVHYYYFTDDSSYAPPPGINAFYLEPSTDPVRQSRDVKMNVHKYLPDFDYYIYIDASYSVTKSLSELFSTIDITKSKLWLKRHPRRVNIAQEAKRVKELRKADPERVDEQLEHYKKDKFNIHSGGLYECGVIFRANDPKINKLFEDWYGQIEKFTARDQLSLPYVLDRHNIKPLTFNDYTIRRYLTLAVHTGTNNMQIPNLKQFDPPKNRPRVHYFTPASGDKNLGRAYNKACEMVVDKDDWICIRDGDTMFLTPDWAPQIEAIIERNKDAFDVISCYTNRLGLRYQLLNGNFSADTNITNHVRLAFLQRNKHWDEVVPSPDYTAGLFILFKRSLWDEIKFADGLTQTKNNIFVDADFTQTVLKKKKKIGLAKGIYLFHLYRIWKEDYRNYDHLK